jgi:hypothetical protein
MESIVDIAGLRFGRLTVLQLSGTRDPTSGRLLWECECDCGTICRVTRGRLTSGNTKSCGCLKKDRCRAMALDEKRLSIVTKHGHSPTHKRSPEYSSWRSMISRCYQSNFPSFHRYGGRGIRVCESWRDDFLAFLNDMGTRLEGYTLDRIDNNGNYEPNNCRWASRKEQSNNRSNHHYVLFKGEQLTIAEMAQKLGVTWYFIRDRIRNGKTIHQVEIDAQRCCGRSRSRRTGLNDYAQ